MKNRIITISRQYGSGGRKIAQSLAMRLNIPFYDKEIIELAAKQSGLLRDFFDNPEQKNDSFRDPSANTAFDPPLNDKVYLAQFSAIYDLAAQGPCVIVGRGAGGALKEAASLLNVFIYADIEIRKQRAIEEYGDSPHKIKEFIDSVDKKRATYFKFYTGVNGSQMENYNLCIDSGYTGIENAVTLIETAYFLET